VVAAMSSWQKPRLPLFASELDPRIVQVHVIEYKNPGQLQDGDVLVVGAGNSGAEIAIELAGAHRVLLSGPDTGQLPFRPETMAGRLMMPYVGKVSCTVSSPPAPRSGGGCVPNSWGGASPVSGSKRKTSRVLGWTGSSAPSGLSTVTRNSRMDLSWTSPTWSGAPDSTLGSPGSTCRFR
jgi:hypothetical protein